jgi:dolichol-phosphate mannosyltransferase
MGRKVMDAYMTITEKNTDFMNMVLWMGFRQSFIPYVKVARARGESKWTFSKKVKHFVDSIVSFSFVPIRTMSIIGALFAFGGMAYAVVVVVGRLLGFVVSNAGFAATMTVLLVGQGFIMLMLGVMGEYIWRTLDEARKRPRFIIEERVQGPKDKGTSAS